MRGGDLAPNAARLEDPHSTLNISLSPSARELPGLVCSCLTVLVFAVLFVGGCVGARPGNDSEGERLCLTVREIKSYEPLDGMHVLVEARVRQYVLFTLDRSCDELGFAQGIAIEGTATSVCDDGFGSILFNDTSTRVRRCRIVAIDPVEDIDAARALIVARETDGSNIRK